MPTPTIASAAGDAGRSSTIANAWAIVFARSPAARGMIRHDRNVMPSANSPMISSGCREFLRVIRLSSARTAARAPRPATHSASTSGTPVIDTLPTTTHGRNALTASTTPAISGTKYARIPGRKIPFMLLGVLEFLVPRHLDRFELRLVRQLRIVVEAVQRGDFLAQVGEAHGQRIEPGKFLHQRDADVFGVGPLHGVTSAALAFLSDLPS